VECLAPSPEIDIEELLRAIETWELPGLRRFWQQRWGVPPRLQSKQMLRLMIAWRLQAEISSGLDPETRRRLLQKSMPRPAPPPVGTQLTREYKGVLHHVVVEEEGARYGSVLYGSLSEVAHAITGTHWNGPRFFGLRHR
jgi:hypothetical protein